MKYAGIPRKIRESIFLFENNQKSCAAIIGSAKFFIPQNYQDFVTCNLGQYFLYVLMLI